MAKLMRGYGIPSPSAADGNYGSYLKGIARPLPQLNGFGDTLSTRPDSFSVVPDRASLVTVGLGAVFGYFLFGRLGAVAGAAGGFMLAKNPAVHSVVESAEGVVEQVGADALRTHGFGALEREAVSDTPSSKQMGTSVGGKSSDRSTKIMAAVAVANMTGGVSFGTTTQLGLTGSAPQNTGGASLGTSGLSSGGPPPGGSGTVTVASLGTSTDTPVSSKSVMVATRDNAYTAPPPLATANTAPDLRSQLVACLNANGPGSSCFDLAKAALAAGVITEDEYLYAGGFQIQAKAPPPPSDAMIEQTCTAAPNMPGCAEWLAARNGGSATGGSNMMLFGLGAIGIGAFLFLRKRN